MLASELPEIIEAKAEGVLAADQAHRVLILPIVGEAELRDVGGATKTGNPEAGIIGLISVETVGREQGKIEANAAIVEAKLVGPRGMDNVSVGKTPSHR